jgi:monolysocardiolipin acyltransferase
MSRIVVGGVGLLCKGFLKAFTRTKVHNYDGMINLIERRNKGIPLLTVSNHTSTLDDPLIFGILPVSILFNLRLMRWSLGAKDILFTNPLYNWFFTKGKVICLERGGGLQQPAMDEAVRLLSDGEWVHIFPEGKIVPDSQTLLGDRLKWGVARLVIDPVRAPLLLPIIHHGMEDIKPLNRWIRLFKPLKVTIGRPIDTSAVRVRLADESIKQHRSRVTAFVADQMRQCYGKGA